MAIQLDETNRKLNETSNFELPELGFEEQIDIRKIKPQRNQIRKIFDNIEDFAEEIKVHGVLSPLIVKLNAKKEYEIVCGERRYRAALLAGLSKLPCKTIIGNQNKIFEIHLAENIQRETLKPIELYDAIYELNTRGYGNEDISRLMGRKCDKAFISKAIAIAEYIRDSISSGFSDYQTLGRMTQGFNLTIFYKIALLGKTDMEKALQCIEKIASTDISKKQAENFVDAVKFKVEHNQVVGNLEDEIPQETDINNKETSSEEADIKTSDKSSDRDLSGKENETIYPSDKQVNNSIDQDEEKKKNQSFFSKIKGALGAGKQETKEPMNIHLSGAESATQKEKNILSASLGNQEKRKKLLETFIKIHNQLKKEKHHISLTADFTKIDTIQDYISDLVVLNYLAEIPPYEIPALIEIIYTDYPKEESMEPILLEPIQKLFFADIKQKKTEIVTDQMDVIAENKKEEEFTEKNQPQEITEQEEEKPKEIEKKSMQGKDDMDPNAEHWTFSRLKSYLNSIQKVIHGSVDFNAVEISVADKKKVEIYDLSVKLIAEIKQVTESLNSLSDKLYEDIKEKN